MSHFRVARRYAHALITLAEEQKKLEKVFEDLDRIGSVIRSSRELALLLQNPSFGKEKKRTILKEIFSKRVDDLTYRFLMLLVDKGRENVILEIIDRYKHMLDEKMGIVRAEVKSVIALDKRQEKSLQKQLEGYTGSKVVITYSLDRNLKGGFLARMGDTVIDASIRRQLELLEKKFMSDGTITN